MAFQIPKEAIDIVNRIDAAAPNGVLAFLTILVIGLIFAKILQVVGLKIIRRLVTKTKTKIDDIILEKIRSPLLYILILIILQISFIPLEIKAAYFDSVIRSLVIVLITYIILVVFDVVIDIWGYGFAARTKSTIDEAVLPLLHKFSKVFFVIIGLIFILDEWGVQIAPILASLGIAGLAVAFALQNTLGNIFGGMSMMMDKTIKVGDRIQLEDGTMGEIQDVGLRSTKIRTFDNEMIIMPNGKLAESRVQNLVLPTPATRVSIDFGAEYGSDIDRVERAVLDVIKGLDTLKDPDKKPHVWFFEMGDFALKFRAVFWVADYKEKWDAKVKATKGIYAALRKNKIGIPFPTRTIYMHKEK